MKQKSIMKILQKMYFVVAAIAIILVLFIADTFQVDVYRRDKEDSIILYENWDMYDKQGNYLGQYKDFSGMDENGTVYLMMTLPEELDYDSAMGFYTVHMNVRVYAGEKLVYQHEENRENPFGSTSGYVVNIMPKLYQYRGERMVIELNTPYRNTRLPDIFVGSTHNIYIEEIGSSVIPFLIALITMVMGVVICSSWIVFRRQISEAFLYLGVFSINVAVYNLNDQVLMQVIFQDNVFPAYLSFISLMLLPVSFLLFIKELYKNSYDKIWYALLGINYANVILSIVLQVLDILDLKNMLITVHGLFVVLFLSVVAYTVREIRRYKMSLTMKINISLIMLITFCLIVDMVRYYLSDGMSTGHCANTAFLIYIVVIAINEIEESRKLAEKGRHAGLYEKMAYTDKITGLGNRMAHEKTLEQADVKKHQYIIGMFDLNNLKRCNDTMGHSAGDEYIQQSAKILKETFGEPAQGNVFRIGGDEFCVVLTDRLSGEYESAIADMKERIELYNQNSESVKIQIAYGYAEYDEAMDAGLKETRSRADSMMYENKFRMKKEESQ